MIAHHLTRSMLKSYRRDLKAIYGPYCIWCGCKFTKKNWPTVEHLVPREFGGGNEIENLRLSCKPCNNDRQTWYQIAMGMVRDGRQLFWSNKLGKHIGREEYGA